MIFRLILAAAFLALAYYAWQRIQTLPPTTRRQVWWRVGMGALIVLAVLAVATGRLHWLGGAVAIVLASLKFGASALFRLWPLLRASGRDAVFRTDHLEVRFVPRTSQLHGTVLKGPHAGADLRRLSAEELQTLADHYQTRDKKSYYLVRIFLQRAGANVGGGSEQTHNDDSGFPSSPSRDEALQILGLSGNPDRDEIIAAHRKLIQKLHPDRGGNDYLAARVNQAKDVLLKD